MDFTQVILQIAVLFIIMFLGYDLRRRNIISEDGVKNYSSLIFYVTMPALIISSMANTSLKKASDLGQIVIASLISYTFFILVSLVIPRLLKVEDGSKGLFKFMTIFGNAGFIGFPMLVAILDESAVFLGAVLNIPFNVLLFSLGVYYIVSDKGHGHKMKLSFKQFMNPGLIATIIGVGVILSGIGLPSLVLRVASTLGAVTTPVAMIVVGASLCGVNSKEMIKNYRIFILSGIRMLIFPLVVGLILRMINLDGMIIAVAMVIAGMPIGTTTVIMARQYDGNVLEASEAVFISTVLLIVTAPFLVMMIQLIAR